MRYMRLWPLVIALVSCQGEDSQLDSIGDNLRNNGSISLIRNTIPTDDRLPNLPVNPAYFVVMNDVKDNGTPGLIAYPVNCEESEADKVLGAFGLSKSTASNTSFGVNDLKTRFEADKQPVLNCSAIQASADQRQVSAVFRLQNAAGQTTQQNPTYYLKFQGFPEHLFQVGCLDILNSFAAGSDESVNFAEAAIPLADPHALYYLDQNVPATELGTEVKGDKGIRRLICRSSGLALPQPNALPIKANEAEFATESRMLRVENGDVTSYVYAWKGASRRLECPGASEADLLQAFAFAANSEAEPVQPSDPAVVAADELEPLRCVNPLFPQTFSVGFRTVDVTPELHAFKSARESSELFTFGCASAENFFVGETIGRELMIPVAAKSLDFLLSHPNLSKPTQYVDRVHVPCSTLPYSPLRDSFEKIYREVSGGQTIDTDTRDQVVEACLEQPGLCTDAYLQLKSVDILKKSEIASSDVVLAAFNTALRRSPFPEELNFFLRKFKLNDSVRPYYSELVDFVKKMKVLDRALFVSSVRYAFGTDYQGPLLDDWTTRLINTPTLVITADSLKKEHEAYILSNSLDAVIKRVYDVYLKTTATSYQLTQLKKQIVTDKTLKPLYQDIVNMLSTLKECRKLDPKVETSSISLLKARTKVKFVKGTWTALGAGKDMVGPAGHPGLTGGSMTLASTNLGHLLIRTQTGTTWGAWTAWKDTLTFKPFTTVGAIINDTKGAYGDNSGSLEVCFE